MTHPSTPGHRDPASPRAGSTSAWPRRLLAALAAHGQPAQTATPTHRRAEHGSPNAARVLAAYHAENTVRSREATMAAVRAGYHVGPLPFGYRAQRIPVASTGRRRCRVRLMIEPVEAATVGMIFAWRVSDHLSLSEIARRLTASRYPAPLHPATGRPVRWSRKIVAPILRNPTYTGRTVWGRYHVGQAVPPDRWAISAPGAHPAVIDDATFLAAQPSPRQRLELAAAWRMPRPSDPYDPTDEGGAEDGSQRGIGTPRAA